jgi:hypothetical protein
MIMRRLLFVLAVLIARAELAFAAEPAEAAAVKAVDAIFPGGV